MAKKKITTEKTQEKTQEKARIRGLAEFQDEEAIDLLADLLVPASNIFTDKAVKQFMGTGPQDHKSKQQTFAELAKSLLKRHKKDMLQILQLLADGEYHCTPVSLIADVLTVMNDRELMGFFSGQGIDITAVLSGVSSEATPEDE